MDKALLEIICCPVTLSPLEPLSRARLAVLNRAIGAGQISNRGGTKVTQPMEEALVTRDGRFAYPVRDGIPVLLEEEAVPVADLQPEPRP